MSDSTGVINNCQTSCSASFAANTDVHAYRHRQQWVCLCQLDGEWQRGQHLHQLHLHRDRLPPSRTQQSSRGMATGEVTLPLLTVFGRLINLLAEQQDIPILAPIIQREIIYRLLIGDQGIRLRQIASAGSQSHQISRAIDWLKSNYTSQLRIDDLAKQVNMSVSTFHHHFRALTAMSPLQFQKRLRLNEARRLMLIEPLDATTAAFQVGYESASQFSREYSRLFGAPPLRDITNLRQMAVDGSA